MIKILIVDDEEMIHIMLQSLFNTQQDMKIIGGAFNGEEAIEFARQNAPDAIIMDVNMPVVNGLEATRKITTEMPHVVVIGLSFHDNPMVVNDMLKAGASAYITKDEISNNLCAAIRKETNK